jgi:hypothetical protein
MLVITHPGAWPFDAMVKDPASNPFPPGPASFENTVWAVPALALTLSMGPVIDLHK